MALLFPASVLPLRPFRSLSRGFGTTTRTRTTARTTPKTTTTTRTTTTNNTTSRLPRGFASLSAAALRESRGEELSKLVEVQQFEIFRQQLRAGSLVSAPGHAGLLESGMEPEMVRLCVDAGMATFATHVESRIASQLGYGFYTIGPCGEENMAALALALTPQDPLALHYRHLSTQLARQLASGRPLEEILLDRARGYTCSVKDPVTGGVHCSLGGGASDFIVTSTLASQAPAAVGRALGSQLAATEGLKAPFGSSRCVSVVSLGDGSANNGHFLSAVNLAEYAAHRGFKCPVLFVVSDNDICISLRGNGWLQQFLQNRVGMPRFEADGNDLGALYKASSAAASEVRRFKRPAILAVSNLKRRFGHAATDRQDAYLSSEEIESAVEHNPLEAVCARALEEGVFGSWDELAERFEHISNVARDAFLAAAAEPRISERRETFSVALAVNSKNNKNNNNNSSTNNNNNNNDKISINNSNNNSTNNNDNHNNRNHNNNVSAPLRPSAPPAPLLRPSPFEPGPGRRGIMRKHMNRVIRETLESVPEAVYMGEDVRHGGYYLVTEGLAADFPSRVQDFPPDETGLMGAGIGYAQAGLLPIVEIPYAKYLDCGADQYYEAALNYWLSNGKQPNGMIIRLQGFDRGVFGGNFHTHNMLSIPPGIDVVCFSNGADYVRGFRRAVQMAKQGRVVMTVDSTALMNQRHLHGRDDAWLTPYPEGLEDALDFEGITRYGPEGARCAVVTYGNGVQAALHAAKVLQEQHNLEVAVLDSPCLSQVPGGLSQALANFDQVLFADVCKAGQNPLAGSICELQRRRELPRIWGSTAAPFTYNPLGSTLTFLSEQDVVEGVLALQG